MKAFFLVALIAISQANLLTSKDKHHDDEEMTIDDFNFMNKMFQTMYSSFIQGLYRAPTNPISEDCFGEWISADFDFINKFFDELAEFRVPYNDAKTLANGIVDGIYKNERACKFSKVYKDLDNFCGDDECDDKVWNNM